MAINRRIAEMERPLHGLGRSGPVMYGLSAIDTALWDLVATLTSLPLFKFLGGDSGVLTKYASLMRYGGDTDAVAQNVERARSYGLEQLSFTKRQSRHSERLAMRWILMIKFAWILVSMDCFRGT